MKRPCLHNHVARRPRHGPHARRASYGTEVAPPAVCPCQKRSPALPVAPKSRPPFPECGARRRADERRLPCTACYAPPRSARRFRPRSCFTPRLCEFLAQKRPHARLAARVEGARLLGRGTPAASPPLAGQPSVTGRHFRFESARQRRPAVDAGAAARPVGRALGAPQPPLEDVLPVQCPRRL